MHSYETFFSSDQVKSIQRSFFISFVVLCLGISIAIILRLPVTMSVGLALAIFFGLLLWEDPLLFIFFLIPIRMVSDGLGNFISIGLWDGVYISPSQAIGALVFFSGIWFFIRYRVFYTIKTFWPFWLLIGWGIISALYSIDAKETMQEVLRILDILILATIAYKVVRDRSDFGRLVLVMLISAIIPMAVGLWQFVTGITYISGGVEVNRILGTFTHPNVFGSYLAFVSILSFFCYQFFVTTFRGKFFALLLFSASFLLLILTLSRVGWAVLAIFFVAWIWMRYRHFFFPLALISLVIIAFITPLRERITDVFRYSSENSVSWRFEQWTEGINKVFLDERVLYGFGLETFPVVMQSIRPLSQESPDAHNDFIKFFVEGGVIGLAVFMFWMGWILYSMYTFLNIGNSWHDKVMYIFMFLFVLSVSVVSIPDSFFKNTPIQWMIWLLVGSLFSFLQSKDKLIKI